MKIRIVSLALAALLLVLAAATSGCESTPLLAPSNAQLTLLASPATAAPVLTLDPTGDTYYSTIFGQLLSGTSADATGGASTTPLSGRNITFVTSAGILAECSSETSCNAPVPGPATVQTDSAGVVYTRLAVTDDDPATVTLEAISGSVTGIVTVNNPLGEPNDAAVAVLRIVPDSPADASSGPVLVSYISESTDPDGDPIWCYRWTITSSVGSTLNLISRDTNIGQTYDAEQSLTAILEVSADPDAELVCDETTRFSPNVDVDEYLVCTNTAPTAVITPIGQENQPTTTIGSVSGRDSFDAESTIGLYQWDCGNGQTPTGQDVLCTYTRGLSTQFFNIELVVTDRGDGEADCAMESNTASITVTVPAL